MNPPDPSDARSAEARLAALERERRRVEAEIVHLLGEAERSEVFRADGHLSVRSWAIAITDWSPAEATARVRTARAVRDLPAFGEALDAGRLPIAHLEVISRVWSNPRVRDRLPEFDGILAGWATRMPYADFAVLARRWEANADADGARQDQRALHAARHVSIRPAGDGYVLRGELAAAQGAIVAEVFAAFCAEEFADDCGLAGAGGELGRSDAQRRADAFVRICQAAAGEGTGVEVTVNVTVDDATFAEEVERACGGNPPPPDPSTWLTRRCETADGVLLDPADALAMACSGWIRRRVIDAAGVTIDLGRRQRLFTRAAREALELAGVRCVWAGCTNTSTQADHIIAFGRGGQTDQANGAPLCGHHNRFKERGYRLRRDPGGGWHTLRPDGSEVGRPEPPPTRTA